MSTAHIACDIHQSLQRSSLMLTLALFHCFSFPASCDHRPQTTTKRQCLKGQIKVIPTINLQCRYCSLAVPDLRDLEAHELSHAMSRPDYRCTVCDATFEWASRFREHMWQHSQARIQCEICHRTFNSPGSYRGHKSQKHPKKTP